MPNKAFRNWATRVRKLKLFEMNNLPIRYKLITLLLVISVLPSIALGFLTGWTIDRIIERQVTKNTLQVIGQVNKSMEFYMNNMQNISYLISFNPDMRGFLYEQEQEKAAGAAERYEVKQFLQGITTLYSEVAGVLVVNSRGQYISNEMYARSSKSLTEEWWYEEAVKNRGVFKIIGQPANRNVTSHVHYRNSEVVSVVRAIMDPDTQQVKGVVLIDLKRRVIAEATKDVRLGKSGYLMIIDEKGEIVYTPEKPFLDKIPGQWLTERYSGAFSKQVDGDTLQFIYQKSPFMNWTTIGVFSTGESASEAKEVHLYVASFIFFVCLFGITSSYYLSHSMSRPIGKLMSFMHQVESGDLTVRYEGKRKDEIGMLGQSFNKMLSQINNLIMLTETQERQKREAELRSLQAHIKPHFLYNTLDTIHWMARKRGDEDVAEVVESLSRLFRIGLSKGHDIIPLEEEIEHIKSYLKIQKARYKDKLNYTLNIHPVLQGVAVLKLVLQPIVENAIYHGIKERRGPGHIVIEAEERDGNLVFYVKDDGAGIPPEKLEVLRGKLTASIVEGEQSKEMKDLGYGMMNVQARIKLTFGEEYGLTIDSEQGKGTVVTGILPIVREPGGHEKVERG